MIQINQPRQDLSPSPVQRSQVEIKSPAAQRVAGGDEKVSQLSALIFSTAEEGVLPERGCRREATAIESEYPHFSIKPDSKEQGVIQSTRIEVPIEAPVTTVPEMAFGKTQWARYFGDIGVEPPLPSDIVEILTGPCPIWSDQKVLDTHLLVLVPEKVNGQPFCIDLLETLVKSPKGGGSSTGIDRAHSWAGPLQEYGLEPTRASHWILLPKQVLPGSTDKDYRDQVQYVKDLNRRTGVTYKVAHLLDAMTGALVNYVRSRKMAFDEQVPVRCSDLWGRVREKTNGYRLLLHGSSFWGLRVSRYHNDYADVNDGVLVSRKF